MDHGIYRCDFNDQMRVYYARDGSVYFRPIYAGSWDVIKTQGDSIRVLRAHRQMGGEAFDPEVMEAILYDRPIPGAEMNQVGEFGSEVDFILDAAPPDVVEKMADVAAYISFFEVQPEDWSQEFGEVPPGKDALRASAIVDTRSGFGIPLYGRYLDILRNAVDVQNALDILVSVHASHRDIAQWFYEGMRDNDAALARICARAVNYGLYTEEDMDWMADKYAERTGHRIDWRLRLRQVLSPRRR